MYNIQILYYNSTRAILNFSLTKGKMTCGNSLKRLKFQFKF